MMLLLFSQDLFVSRNLWPQVMMLLPCWGALALTWPSLQHAALQETQTQPPCNGLQQLYLQLQCPDSRHTPRWHDSDMVRSSCSRGPAFSSYLSIHHGHITGHSDRSPPISGHTRVWLHCDQAAYLQSHKVRQLQPPPHKHSRHGQPSPCQQIHWLQKLCSVSHDLILNIFLFHHTSSDDFRARAQVIHGHWIWKSVTMVV